ncbi:MAG: hypothetical protein R3A10_12530 [Caldilineaceae bacterium]
MDEARKNLVLPLNDFPAARRCRHRAAFDLSRLRAVHLLPGHDRGPRRCGGQRVRRSYKILANVEVGDDCSGAILPKGSRFGGHSPFIKDKKLYYVYNSWASRRSRSSSPTRNSRQVHTGRGVHPAKARASTTSRTVRPSCTLMTRWWPKAPCAPKPASSPCAVMACVLAATARRQGVHARDPGQVYTGGAIQFVEVSVEKEQYRNIEMEMAAMASRSTALPNVIR